MACQLGQGFEVVSTYFASGVFLFVQYHLMFLLELGLANFALKVGFHVSSQSLFSGKNLVTNGTGSWVFRVHLWMLCINVLFQGCL